MINPVMAPLFFDEALAGKYQNAKASLENADPW